VGFCDKLILKAGESSLAACRAWKNISCSRGIAVVFTNHWYRKSLRLARWRRLAAVIG